MSEGTSGLVSNYNVSEYSFFVPGIASGFGETGDGMILASKIISQDPSGLLLETLNTVAGSNIFYPNPGVPAQYDNVNAGVLYWVLPANVPPTSGQNGNLNWRYGELPDTSGNIPGTNIPTAFVRNGTVTGSSSDIYNFTNPGVYILDFETLSIPLPCSFPNINSLLNATTDALNGLLVYPGWGFRVFSGPSNGTSTFFNVNWDAISYTYFNDTNQPLIFTCADNYRSNVKNYSRSNDITTPNRSFQNTFISIPIMVQVRGNSGSTDADNIQNRSFANNAVEGVQVFYRSANPLMRFGLTAGSS
jgi:hypothetical protein